MLEGPDGAKSVVLDRVRASIGTTTLADAESAWKDLPRNYRVEGRAVTPEGTEARTLRAVAPDLGLLVDRLKDYDAVVHLTSRASLTQAIVRALEKSRARRLLVPQGFPADLLPEGLPHKVDSGLSAKELDSFDTVLTTATLAIAETGTLVLQYAPGQGRRATTLVPDTHLCVLRASDVVATVPEAMRRLQATATLPTTFISGPSATADIEMTRIKGVHGPRFLHVVLVEE